MNITFAIDEKVARDARAAAQAMGKSLNQVVGDHLEALAGTERVKLEIEEMQNTAGTGNSQGRQCYRDEIYEDRLNKQQFLQGAQKS